MRFLCVALLLSGCGAIDDGLGGRTVYAGVAEATDQPTLSGEKFIVNRDIEVLGAWIDRRSNGDAIGFGLGYRAMDITAAPLDCALVIFVKTDSQLESVRALTEQFYSEGESPCIVR